MYLDKLIKETKIYFIFVLIIAFGSIFTGILFQILNIGTYQSQKSFIGLSAIPFGIAIVYFTKYKKLKDAKNKRKKEIVLEIDERLIALKNRADSISLKLIQFVVIFSYFFYTQTKREEVFESTGWWLMLVIFLMVLIIQPIVNGILTNAENKLVEDEGD